MRKYRRKFKIIGLIFVVVLALVLINKISVRLSEKANGIETIEISEENENFIRELVYTIFGYKIDTPENTDLVTVSLVRVVDGDTIVVLNNGEELKVRMIGVDTPESVHSDNEKNNVYGDMASDFTKEYLEGYKTVYLQYDKEQTDIYGRTLAYVWLEDDVDVKKDADIENFMYNAILLKNGYAINKEFKPNVAYADDFEDLRIYAESNHIGLWNEAGYETVVYQ